MRRIEVTEEELDLLIEALDDASFYRDARSRAVERGIRKREQRGLPPASSVQAGHRQKASSFLQLAAKLKSARQG